MAEASLHGRIHGVSWTGTVHAPRDYEVHSQIKMGCTEPIPKVRQPLPKVWDLSHTNPEPVLR